MNRRERLQIKWETIKPKGLKSYVIKQGVFVYGLTNFVLFVFVAPLIDYDFF